MNSAGIALRRAEWQPILFGAPNRADLAGCVADWPLSAMRIRVHRNHGFEAVSSATRAYGAWNGLDFEWRIGGYDDSLTFAVDEEAAVDVIWYDTTRLRCASDEAGEWLGERMRALRAQTTNPIVLLAWPLPALVRARLLDDRTPGLYVPDLSPLAETLGRQWIDARAQSISGTRLGNRACLHIARELACCWIPAAALPPRKVVAVDLDGTLYHGVLAEDGPGDLTLTDGHRNLHTHLAALREAGMLLALVSRNERVDVENLFRQRSDFPLRLTDFAAIDVSWNDKPDALRQIAATLGIGDESIVFVDDNAGELAAVASSLAVQTVHAGIDGNDTLGALRHVAGVFRWHRSEEDRMRNADLASMRERAAIADSVVSPDDYWRSLDVRLDYLVGPRPHVARLAELCAKTNQFNLALRRMNDAEIARRLDDDPSSVVAVRLGDRLSDSGIVAAVIGRHRGSALHIDELCVSCRALGRRIEDSMLTRAFVVIAGNRSPTSVVFALQRGPRNAPAREWLARYASARLDDGATSLEIPFAVVSGRAISSAIRMELAE